MECARPAPGRDPELTAQGATVKFGPVEIASARIFLPNGMRLRYNIPDQDLYGAKLLENITQALARIVVMDAALRLEELGYRFVLQALTSWCSLSRTMELGKPKRSSARKWCGCQSGCPICRWRLKSASGRITER